MRLGKSEGMERVDFGRVRRQPSQDMLKGLIPFEDRCKLTAEDLRKLRRQLNPRVELERCGVCGLPLRDHNEDCEE